MKGLQIKGNEIEFQKWDLGEIAIGEMTKNFKISFDEISLVVLSPRMAFDDEIVLISILDKNKNFYQFSEKEIGKNPIFEFEKRLGLKNPIHIENQKFSEEDFEDSSTDKIIYPNELYWEELFVKPTGFKKVIIRFFKFFFLKRSKTVFGKFNPIVLQFLNSNFEKGKN